MKKKYRKNLAKAKQSRVRKLTGQNQADEQPEITFAVPGEIHSKQPGRKSILILTQSYISKHA